MLIVNGPPENKLKELVRKAEDGCTGIAAHLKGSNDLHVLLDRTLASFQRLVQLLCSIIVPSRS